MRPKLIFKHCGFHCGWNFYFWYFIHGNHFFTVFGLDTIHWVRKIVQLKGGKLISFITQPCIYEVTNCQWIVVVICFTFINSKCRSETKIEKCLKQRLTRSLQKVKDKWKWLELIIHHLRYALFYRSDFQDLIFSM